ncbi:MAG: carboxypeptidase M32 [Sarcina sp.]
MQNILDDLKQELKKIGNLNSGLALIYWDMQTKMPRQAAAQRAGIIEELSGQIFKLQTSPKMGALLDEAEKNIDTLKDSEKAMIKIARKEYDATKKIPEERYRAFVSASAISSNAWQDAKEAKNFELFKPHLKTMVDFQREFIEYWGYKGNKYNTLLNKFDEGATVEKIDGIFNELKEGTITLLNKIKNSKKEIDNSIFKGEFDREGQEKISRFILNKMGYNLDLGRIDESMHPFTVGFGNKDVRITTNFGYPEFTFALFSCIHEGGHAIYEQNIADELQKTGVESGLSMSIHESQSRFYENLLGRSREFWSYFLPFVKYEFSQFENVSLEDFYNALNLVEPTFIRTEADELTYNLHIIIRYEIEKALINGTLEVEDVKEEWNKKYKEYLGIEPTDDSIGILQDMHWSDGSFGYFPSYSLGNLYSAQIFAKLKEEEPNLMKQIENGNLNVVYDWLKENVHQYGATYTASELIQKITGEELQVKYFLEYINKKYTKIYNL